MSGTTQPAVPQACSVRLSTTAELVATVERGNADDCEALAHLSVMLDRAAFPSADYDALNHATAVLSFRIKEHEALIRKWGAS